MFTLLFRLNVKSGVSASVSAIVFAELAHLCNGIAEYYCCRHGALTLGTKLGWRSLELTMYDCVAHARKHGITLPQVNFCPSGMGELYSVDLAPETGEELKMVQTLCKTMMFELREIRHGARTTAIGFSNVPAVRSVFADWQRQCVSEIRRLNGKPNVLKKPHRLGSIHMYDGAWPA